MRIRSIPVALLGIAALVSACASPAAPPPAAPLDLGPWKQVERGMSRDQVRGLLGEPAGFEWSDREGSLVWRYPGKGAVTFQWTTTTFMGAGTERIERSDPQVAGVQSPRR